MSFIRDLGSYGQARGTSVPGLITLASLFEPVEKVADRNAEHLGHFNKDPRSTVDATLVFVRLLIGDAYQVGAAVASDPA